MGPGWDCADLEHTCTTEEEQAGGDDISTGDGSGAGLREPQSHTLTLLHQEVSFSLSV